MAVIISSDSFIFDQITRGSDFYNYGSPIYPTFQAAESWSWAINNIGITLPTLSRASSLYTGEQWAWLCWWVSAFYLQNNNSYSITTNVRPSWTLTFWWSWAVVNLTWTEGSMTVPAYDWRVRYWVWYYPARNLVPHTSVNFSVGYILPGSATEYSEDILPWPHLYSSNSASLTCPAYSAWWSGMVWIEWNTFCFSDSNWFKKVAQSNLIASWVSAQPWLWWIDDTVWSTGVPPAANWYEYWIHYVWSDWNVYRTSSQINKDTLWAWSLAKQWLMWMENWNDAWTLGFIWPKAQKMLLWGWSSAPTNVKF